MSVFPKPTTPTSTSWIAFEPCCGGNTLYFSVNATTNPPTPGINVYNGISGVGYDPITNSYVGLSTQCYRIYRGTVLNPTSPITAANYLNLNIVPSNFPGNGVYTWDSTSTYDTPCSDAPVGFCPDCPIPLYVVWPCDDSNVPVVTDTDLSAYVNDYATIQVDPTGTFDCYYVVNYSVDTNQSTLNPVAVVVEADLPCSCNCTCYEIVGSGKLYYIDCDGLVQATSISGYWKGCSLVYPQGPQGTSNTYIITDAGNCVDGECPIPCYELVDCAGIEDPIYTTAQSLLPYATLGEVVIIEGYTNCWTVNDVVECDCAIDVVVTQVYADCPTCTAGPNYILTNCDDLGTIIYTSDDLSAYVDQVVELSPDCPGCWIVNVFPNAIPSDVPITITNAFDDCEACKTTYYVLEDCLDIEPNIITSTDLSEYIGQIITLEWCPNTCWRVSVSQTSTGAGVLGSILNEYTECELCLTSFPCVCSRVKNHDSVSHNYDYLDCEGIVQTITLLSGERSERICMAYWLTSYPTDYVEYFGNCIESPQRLSPFECPPQIYPKRIIRPGYVTPICSTEKYERITCKSAEVLYKSVLELRYGISNCCPEEDDKWLIRKQLIDLQALRDPLYECEVPACGCGQSSCGCQQSSCGCGQSSCGCNTLNTCNSH
jgi:hypothetical protein